MCMPAFQHRERWHNGGAALDTAVAHGAAVARAVLCAILPKTQFIGQGNQYLLVDIEVLFMVTNSSSKGLLDILVTDVLSI